MMLTQLYGLVAKNCKGLRPAATLRMQNRTCSAQDVRLVSGQRLTVQNRVFLRDWQETLRCSRTRIPQAFASHEILTLFGFLSPGPATWRLSRVRTQRLAGPEFDL